MFAWNLHRTARLMGLEDGKNDSGMKGRMALICYCSMTDFYSSSSIRHIHHLSEFPWAQTTWVLCLGSHSAPQAVFPSGAPDLLQDHVIAGRIQIPADWGPVFFLALSWGLLSVPGGGGGLHSLSLHPFHSVAAFFKVGRRSLNPIC